MKLNRRQAVGVFAGALPATAMARGGVDLAPAGEQLPPGVEPDSGPFAGTRKSLGAYRTPEWFADAKFGIWAHWGPQSAIEDGDWYARNMYLQGQPQYDYHVEHYGHPSKFGYKDTIPAWKAEKFDPAALMKLYKKAGAKYFMTMGVHHDNFDLWNSKHQPWNAANMGPKIDIVGAWRKAARAEGLRFAISEHLWITHNWFSPSHGSDLSGPLAGVPYDGADPKYAGLYVNSDQIFRELPWNEDGIPLSWKRHWYMRIKDLVDQHEPDLLYSDGSLPFEEYGLNLLAHFYNASAKRNGGRVDVVYTSKRIEDFEQGIATLDRERGVVDKIWPQPWQTDTCIGNWHYQRGMQYKTPKRIIDMLVDVVSRNGNLMLNFPLPASGMLDLEELNILGAITGWMAVNADAIHGTRPWKMFGEGPGTASSAQGGQFNENARKDLTAEDVRFTTKGGVLYAFVMGWPDYQTVIHPLALKTALRVGAIQSVELLGFDGKIDWVQDEAGLKVLTPPRKPCDHAIVFKVRGA